MKHFRKALKSIAFKTSWIQSMIVRKIKHDKVDRLDLGSGPRKGEQNEITLDGCLGADILVDATQGLPFRANSFREVYSSHFLEHLNIGEIEKVLIEVRRILVPGGELVLCLPDAARYLYAYAKGVDYIEWAKQTGEYEAWEPAHYKTGSPIDGVNYIAYLNGDHRYMFDIQSACGVLGNAGFTDIKVRKPTHRLDMVERRGESIYISGRKGL